MYLPSQHCSVHELPDDQSHLASVLATAVRDALAHQQADGNFEDPGADDDIGDMGLGVVSLLCLAWQRNKHADSGLAETEFIGAVRRGVDFFLRERVYRTDNPGEPFYRIRNSGQPYARYMPGTGEHPFGDWPSTVWAMLHAVNVLDLGEGLLTDEQYAQVRELAIGYWRWLTETSLFNPQGTANQAIGSITAALMLARHLRGCGRAPEGDRIAADALRLYAEEIQARRVSDRGYELPLEHGAGHDQNYVPISLSFLAQAHKVSGHKCFLDDGEQIARHLDARLSARGFDYGGPRYSEQHSGMEGMYGLRYFSSRIRSDLGRYLGDRRVAYYPEAANGAPSGHFAFTSVWFWQDDSRWFRADESAHRLPLCTPYSVRGRAASVSYTGDLTPYLIDAAGTAVIESVTGYQHGIGPVLTHPDGRSVLLTRPLGPLRTRDAVDVETGFAAKLVTKAVVTREQVMIAAQQLVVCDDKRVYLIAVVGRAGLPGDATLEFLAGLPYTEAEDRQQRKILTVSQPGGDPFSLGEPGASLTVADSLLAGRMLLRAPGGLRVVNPPPGRTCFNSPETIGLTLEQTAFALADDPRGYGDPDSGWQRVTMTNQVLAAPLDTPASGPAVFALSYGPADDAPLAVGVDPSPDGITVHTPDFSVFIGEPAGDAHGEPLLRLSPASAR